MNYLKENFKFIYSLILIVFIPVAIIASTLIDIRNTQSRMDGELKDKAILAESIFAPSAEANFDQVAALQSQIDQTIAANTDIEEITVLKPQPDGFLVLASSNNQSLDLSFKSDDYTKAWVSDERVTTLTLDQANSNQRYWVVVSPLKNASLQKEGLLVFKVSLDSADTVTRKNITEVLIILAVTIFFVLLLLINHFRFFEYAVSFKSLQDVDRMKDDFISIASHEMKTPMAAIKGYLSMIDEGVAGNIDKKAKTHLDKVNANVRRLDVLVNELLEVSRLEQRRVQFDMQPVDMTEIVQHIFGELKVKADEKKLYLKSQEVPAPHVMVFADPERVAQILDNIVGNAIKYTEKGGIEVSFKILADKFYATVKDTGIGIAEADQKRMFEKFYRVQNRKTIDISGTGLGLWISREMARRMNGDITMTSQAGVGSEFTVSFPIIHEKN